MKKTLQNKMHYTIVEMMMVVAVFMIILAMAIAAWLSSGNQAQIRNAAREASGLLNLARSKAIAERTNVGVFFSTSGSSNPDSELAADSGSGDPNPFPGKSAGRIYYCDSNGTRSGFVDFEDWHTFSGFVTLDFPSSFNNLYNSSSEARDTTACIVFDRMGRVIYSRNMAVVNGGLSMSVVAGSTVSNSIPADSSYYILTVNPYTGRITTAYHEPN